MVPRALPASAGCGLAERSRLAQAYAITYAYGMNTRTASEARANLFKLMDETAASHQPITITGRRNNAVLLSAEDWLAIQETLFLLAVPGMRESLREGMSASLDEFSAEPGW